MAETKAERRAAWKRRSTEQAAALRKAKATVTLKKKRTIPLTAQSPAQIRVAAWRKANPQRTIVDVSGRHTRVHTGIQSLTRPEQQQYMTLFTDYARGKQIAQQNAQRLYILSQKMKASERKRIEQKPEQRVMRIALPAEKTKTQQEKERKKKLVEMGITVPYERGESLESIKKRQSEFERRREAPLPKWITNFTGSAATLTKTQNKIVHKVFDTDGNITKNKAALTSFQNYVFTEVKKNPEKIAQFASFPAMIRIGATAATRYGVTQLITKIPHGETIARNTVKIVFTAVGAVYTYNVLDRVTEPVVTGYRDGKSTSKTETLPNGDKETTTTTEQVPQYRMPTRAEQVERLGGILATELAPMHITHSGIKKGMNKGYTPQPKIKPKVKISKKITRAGTIIKTIPTKIKTVPGKVIKAPKTIKTKVQKAKEARAIKKRHDKLKKEAKKAEKKMAKEKVPVLKATKGELQLLRTKRSKLLEEQSKAKGKQRIEIKKRLKKVEKELAFKEAFKPKKKVVVLSNSAYTKITKLSKLKAKIKVLIAKIRAIPAAVAKRMGINKTKEIKKLTVRLREVDAVKSYIVMVKKGVPKKTVVDKLQKLPENKLQVLDTKTGKIIKDVGKTVDDIELRVIKPSKKPPTEYKEVRVGKGLVQLQKQTQKSAIKTVVLTKIELKSLNTLNAKAKTITKTKPKTRQRQLQKVTTQIKSKQKALLLYQQRLKTNTAKLKQIQKSLTLLATKQTPRQATLTRQRITSISTQVHKIVAVLSLISSTLITTKQILSTTAAVAKLPIIVPVIPAVPIPRKAKTIKKKKKASIAYEDWFIKNSIPTFKSLYG